MTKLHEIQPCPRCGKQRYKKYRPQRSRITVTEWDTAVFCPGCDMEGPLCRTAKEAIDAWNLIAALTAKPPESKP